MAQEVSRGRELLGLLKDAVREWYSERTFQLGAAMAFYAVFSLSPLLLVTVSVAGMVFGEEAARGEVVGKLEGALGPTVARALEDGLKHAHLTHAGTWTTLLGLAVLLSTATWVFAQLQEALNTIWKVKARADRTWLDVIKDRAAPFLMVFCCGGLLVGLLVVNAMLAMVDRVLPPSQIPGAVYFWRSVNLGITFALTTALIALVYKVLPDVALRWKDVLIGAAVTALLLLVGNWLIGLYLRWKAVESVYGAAGSLVVILLWVYYSTQVFLFGAQLTHAYATRDGVGREPKQNAVRMTEEECKRLRMS
jgi:membrane protein